MGTKQSKLKNELAALKEAAAKSAKKHADEIEALQSDKRMLEYKVRVLQELVKRANCVLFRGTPVSVSPRQGVVVSGLTCILNYGRLRKLKWRPKRQRTLRWKVKSA